jgi:hypothetical protein
LVSLLTAQEVDSIEHSPEPIIAIDTIIPSTIDSAKFRRPSQSGEEAMNEFESGEEEELAMREREAAMMEEESVNPTLVGAAPAGTSVEYGSVDSSRTDLNKLEIHLYGKAFVKYEDSEVTADYIIFDLKEREVQAKARSFSSQRTRFLSGTNDVKADSLRYNINSEKGIVYGARIQQDNLYIHGAVTKFIKAGRDSLHIDDVIYNRNALITSCSHEDPHWGIRTTKLKMIPEKLAVIGPMDIELMGIPTPLAFPFAFAPLFSFGKASSGLIAPDQWLTIDPNLGIGVRNLGYHFAINERMNLTLKGDIYTRGSYALRSNMQYRQRYKFQGSVDLSYSRQLVEIATSADPSRQTSYAISLNHRQDGKAHPYRTVGGTLKFSVNNYEQRNQTDARSQLNNQINSNFNYQYKINPKLNFSTGISHSQNTSTNSISFTLPQMQLRLSQIYPFKRKKNSASKEKFYEKISFQYNGKFQNSVTTIDTILFTKETLESFRAGFTHEANMTASYKLLEHLSFNTNINYDEFWYLQTFDPTEADENGNITAGEINQGFTPLRDISASAGLSTNVFGTIQFKKGWLRGLRHRMTPSINLSYRPGTESYYEYFDEDPDSFTDAPLRYNPFSPDSKTREKLFRNASLQRGGMSMNYGIDNVFEGKYWSKKDSIEEKFKLFNRVGLTGNYNFQADSLNWSQVNMSASTTLFDRKTTVQISGAFDPYVAVLNSTGTSTRRINKTLISEGRGLLRMDRLNLTVSTSFSLKDIKEWITGENKQTNQNNKSSENPDQGRNRNKPKSKSPLKGSSEVLPELFSWFQDFKIAHIYRIGWKDMVTEMEFTTTAHSIAITSGNIPLSENWSMRVGNISYDLKNKRWVYPSLNLTRQLHCWEMTFGWQPQLDTYTFFIGVKAAPFSQFLKYSRGQNTFGNYGRRF